MATESQIAQNRRNAQLSTGPRTRNEDTGPYLSRTEFGNDVRHGQGKARSSQNAVKLGLFSTTRSRPP